MLRLRLGKPMPRYVPAIGCELQALCDAFYRRSYAEPARMYTGEQYHDCGILCARLGNSWGAGTATRVSAGRAV